MIGRNNIEKDESNRGSDNKLGVSRRISRQYAFHVSRIDRNVGEEHEVHIGNLVRKF